MQELLSWNRPYFSLRSDIFVVMEIMKGELLTKPEATDNIRIFSMLWTLCNLCWKEQSARPTADEIVSLLEPVVFTGEFTSNQHMIQTCTANDLQCN